MAGEVRRIVPNDHAISGARTRAALEALSRPLTVQQLSTALDYPLDPCMNLLRRLRATGRVRCLNPDACRGRVYVRTDVPLPDLDWALYGWVCFSQRRAVLEALDAPRQPADIKRRARYLHPGVRLSANNVRDIIHLFYRRGIVVQVRLRRRAHPQYDLTPTGKTLQRLVWERP